jgi:spore coat polysaccharide biosynthesis protein SpsF (cytidylyltransferase family)
MRWTVDYPDDLDFVRAVFRRFRGREEVFGMEEVIAALAGDTQLAALMPTRARNEGLAHSRAEERARLDSGW